MLVRCKVRFKDFEANTMRNVGDTFEISDERLKSINGTRYGELVEVITEEHNADNNDDSNDDNNVSKRVRRRKVSKVD